MTAAAPRPSILRTATPQPAIRRVAPSRVGPDSSRPFSLAQELEPFGTWVGEPIWVPPKDSSQDFAKFMLRRFGLLASKSDCWSAVLQEHRAAFQQVREIDLCKASIRLPKGRLFVSVTEQDRFAEISDPIPNCVRTRLDEFLEGPGKQRGVKVYYLKPLCVEVGDELIFTSRESVMAAVTLVQDEVFSAYRRMYLLHRPLHLMSKAAGLGLDIPRKVWSHIERRRKQTIDAYQARLEFERRKIALRAANMHRRFRTDGCSFEEMLSLTNPLDRNDVIEQFCIERKLSQAKRNKMMQLGAETIPWFVALSLCLSYAPAIALTFAPPMMVCDPAFVAEMPGSQGVVLKIGHFDEVDGVTHVEI